MSFRDRVKLIGVTLGANLFMDRHVTEVIRSCTHHTLALRHIRPLPTLEAAKMLSHGIVTARLDYCNSVTWNVGQKPEQSAGCSERTGDGSLPCSEVRQCH